MSCSLLTSRIFTNYGFLQRPERLLLSFLASNMVKTVSASTNSSPSLPCQWLDKERLSLRWFFNFCHKNSLKSYKMFSRKKNRKLLNKFAKWGWIGSHCGCCYNIVNIPLFGNPLIIFIASWTHNMIMGWQIYYAFCSIIGSKSSIYIGHSRLNVWN